MTFLYALATLWPKIEHALFKKFFTVKILKPAVKGHKLVYVRQASLLLLFCFIMFSYARAQSQDTLGAAAGLTDIKPLKIGDSIPKDLWHMPLQVVNHPKGKDTITLNDYRDKKLIILDFWATWCSSCIKNFPKLNTLQSRNNEKLKILLVNSKSTRDAREKAQRFLFKRQNQYHLTSIVEDTVFQSLFPHLTIPHYVWVKDGRLLAITYGEDLIQKNLDNAFNDRGIQTAYIPEIEYNTRRPLFENGNGGEPPRYIYKSILTPFINGLRSTVSKDISSERIISRVTFTNIPILTLYYYAYPQMQDLSRARLIIEVECQEQFNTESTSPRWRQQNLYNYEAQFPPMVEEEAKQIIRDDLNRFFGYTVRSEFREMVCWVVQATNNPPAVNFQSDNQSETNLYDNNGSDIFFNNYPLSDLLTELERLYDEPFLDETNIHVPVKLTLPADLYQKSAVKSRLAEHGILLTSEKRKIPVIILSKN